MSSVDTKGELMATDAGLTAEHPVKATPKRRWLQFSLRTMMVRSLGGAMRARAA
jgi:hypothetical protein